MQLAEHECIRFPQNIQKAAPSALSRLRHKQTASARQAIPAAVAVRAGEISCHKFTKSFRNENLLLPSADNMAHLAEATHYIYIYLSLLASLSLFLFLALSRLAGCSQSKIYASPFIIIALCPSNVVVLHVLVVVVAVAGAAVAGGCCGWLCATADNLADVQTKFLNKSAN